MKRIHFDSHGPVKWHYFFWQPWGCLGCLGRGLLFMVFLTLFLFLLSQFRSCRDDVSQRNLPPVESSPQIPTDTAEVISVAVPPINDEDIIEEDGRQLVGNRINVIFGAEATNEQQDEWISKFRELYPEPEHSILFHDRNTKLMSIKVPAEKRQQIIQDLPGQIPNIPFMVFDESIMEGSALPSDPVFSNRDTSWYFDAIKAHDGWEITKGSSDVTIAIVDSYFDLNNVEFIGDNIVSPYSVANGDRNVGLPDSYNPRQPDPVMCHGTMVASMALGALDNGKGSAGIAPDCKFMPISLGGRFGCLAMLQGLLYAINHGATVVNISAGLVLSQDLERLSVSQQIEIAKRRFLDLENVWKYVFDMADKYFVTIVWAAGNENLFTAIDATKRSEKTIKVSAVDRNMSKAMFSNFGNFPDMNIYESTISAPGVQVPGMIPHTDGYSPVDGTSFSSPIVAGACGLIKSLDPTLKAEEIATILKSTGKAVRGNTTIGPVLQIGPALKKVESTFLSYEEIEKFLFETSDDDSVSVTGTILRFLETEEDGALPPLIKMQFISTGAGKGIVKYVSNLPNPTPWWSGEYNAVKRGNEIVLTQEEAPSATEGVFPFSKAKINIGRDAHGKAIVTNLESESVAQRNFHFKRTV